MDDATTSDQAAPGPRLQGLAWVWVAIGTALVGSFGLGLGNLAAGLWPESPLVVWLLPLPSLAGLAGAGLPVCLALIVAHATGGRHDRPPPGQH